MTRARPGEAGFTLIELMISLVLFSLAVAAILAVAVSMTQSFREERLAAATESSARGAMDFIADAVRAASPGVPNGTITDATTCTVVPAGGIAVTDYTDQPDELTLVYASGGVVTSIRNTFGLGTTTITLTDATQISAGDQLLISDGNTGHIVTVLAVTNAAPGDITVASTGCGDLPAAGYPAGSLAIRVLRARFYVGTFDGFANTLLMDPDDDGLLPAEPLAENVEDFQVAVGVDTNNGTPPVNLTWEFATGPAPVAGTVRAIRLTFVTRAAQALQAGGNAFRRPAVEDHPASGAFDNYRRRTLSSTVEIRNLGGSP